MVHSISKSSASQSVPIAKNGIHVVGTIQSVFHIIQTVVKNSAVVKRLIINQYYNVVPVIVCNLMEHARMEDNQINLYKIVNN